MPMIATYIPPTHGALTSEKSTPKRKYELSFRLAVTPCTYFFVQSVRKREVPPLCSLLASSSCISPKTNRIAARTNRNIAVVDFSFRMLNRPTPKMM